MSQNPLALSWVHPICTFLVQQEPRQAEIVSAPNLTTSDRSLAIEIPAAGPPVLAWLAADIARPTESEGPEPMRAHALPYSPADAPDNTVWLHVKSDAYALHLAFSPECLALLPPGSQATGRLMLPVPPPPAPSGEWLHRLRPPMPARFRDQWNGRARIWDVTLDLADDRGDLRFLGISANVDEDGIEFDGVLGRRAPDGRFALALSPTGRDGRGRFEADLIADTQDPALWAVRIRPVTEE